MREKAKWLTQVSLVLALLGCADSDVTPAEQKLADELPTWYAKAQAAGIPLTLAEFQARYPSPPGQKWPELERLLQRLPRVNVLPTSWDPSAPPETIAQRSRYGARERAAVAQLRDWLRNNDGFCPPATVPEDEFFGRSEDSTSFENINLGVQLLAIDAVARASQNDTDGARESLALAAKLIREAINSPNLSIVTRVGNPGRNRLASSAMIVAKYDPSRASQTLSVATEGWNVPMVPALHHACLLDLDLPRSYSAAFVRRGLPATEDEAEPIALSSADSEPRRLTTPLPPEPLNRALMAVLLRTWTTILTTPAKDGAFIDLPQAYRVALTEQDRLTSSEELIEKGLAGWFGITEAWLAFEIQEHAYRDKLRALGRIAEFRAREGRWPETLAEAGVARIAHPLWPESAVRYTAEGSVVQLWSVGLNGVDDQGAKDDRRIVWRLPAASSLP